MKATIRSKKLDKVWRWAQEEENDSDGATVFQVFRRSNDKCVGDVITSNEVLSTAGLVCSDVQIHLVGLSPQEMRDVLYMWERIARSRKEHLELLFNPKTQVAYVKHMLRKQKAKK